MGSSHDIRAYKLLYSSGRAYEIGGNWAQRIPESGKLCAGITGSVDRLVQEILPAREILPVQEILPAR